MNKRYFDLDDNYNDVLKINFIIVDSLIFITVLNLLWGLFYTIPEGNVGITKRFGEATGQVGAGLHFKAPIIDEIEVIEVRTRKNDELLSAATTEQMPITATVSVNWTVERSEALELFQKYGGLKQFENRILDPRLRSASKTAISRYTAEQLIKDRQLVINEIESNLIEEMEGFNVTLDSVQLENVTLPPKYLLSIETKQTEKNLADAEKFKLARQELEAQRDVNVQKAKAEGIKAISIEKAAAISREGKAEAEAITAKAKALKGNNLIVDLTRAQQWDGKYPTTMMGSGTNVLWNMEKNK